MFRIDNPESLNVTDAEISDLLTSVYVGSGFTAPERAKQIFVPSAVRSRGCLLCARPEREVALAGMVIVVPPDSLARRLAHSDEAEMQLLAVSEPYRGAGLGRALVKAAIVLASSLGYRKMVLWTQSMMEAAQQLYQSECFVRAPDRDPTMNDIHFLAYQKQW